MKTHLLTLLAIGISCCLQAQYPVVTIQDIQEVSATNLGNCDDDSPLFGDTVTVRGVVMMDGGLEQLNSAKQVWICKSNGGEWSGVDVYDLTSSNTTLDIDQLLEGDSIEITGVIINYQGETEVAPLGPGSVSLLGQNIPVSFNNVMVSELNDVDRNNNLVTGEKWEGTYASVSNISVASVDFFSSNTRVSFNIQDAAGNLMNVSDRFIVQRLPASGGSFVPPNVGDQFDTIQGVILHSKNNCTGFSGRGYEIHPFKPEHYVYGASAPSIFNLSRNPVVPTSSQSVTISVDITDNDGTITGAELSYATGASSTSYTTVAMTNTGGDTYEATIPASTDGTFVKYYISATDNDSQTTTVPNSDPSLGTYFYTVRDNGLTIYDVQYTPFSNGNSGYIDMEVTVEGVVTASAQANDLGYVYIQQENQLSWGGLNVFGNTALTQLKRGDKVQITGTVSESFGFTVMNNVTQVQTSGTGTAELLNLDPSVFTDYAFANNEQYESMLIGLVNTGGGKVHVVDPNPDAPSNFAEYRVGSDQFDPNSGSRVLTGRVTGSAFSSLNVSFVNDSSWATGSGIMNVDPIVVNDTMNMDTLVGIMYYSFGAMKLLPRNNDDFIGINVALPGDTVDGIPMVYGSLPNVRVYPNPSQDVINIETLFEAGAVYSIELYDISGRQILRRVTRLATEKIFVDGLEAGAYFVKVNDQYGNVAGFEKVIVQ